MSTNKTCGKAVYWRPSKSRPMTYKWSDTSMVSMFVKPRSKSSTNETRVLYHLTGFDIRKSYVIATVISQQSSKFLHQVASLPWKIRKSLSLYDVIQPVNQKEPETPFSVCLFANGCLSSKDIC